MDIRKLTLGTEVLYCGVPCRIDCINGTGGKIRITPHDGKLHNRPGIGEVHGVGKWIDMPNKLLSPASSVEVAVEEFESNPNHEEAIDYDGCDFEVATKLRRGKVANCRVGDNEHALKSRGHKCKVVAYLKGKKYPYITSSGGEFQFAKIFNVEKRLKEPVELMKAILAEGWKYNTGSACWENSTGTKAFSCWNACGKSGFEGYPESFYEIKEIC